MVDLFHVPDESGTNDRMNPVLRQGLDSSRSFGMTFWRWFGWQSGDCWNTGFNRSYRRIYPVEKAAGSPHCAR
jgi:hypothetical protein